MNGKHRVTLIKLAAKFALSALNEKLSKKLTSSALSVIQTALLWSLRHGTGAALHLPIQEVEEEAAVPPSRGPSAYLSFCQVRYRIIQLSSSSFFILSTCFPYIWEKQKPKALCDWKFVPYFTDLDVGLKKDALLSADGSSLEALLKGESMDKRTTTELRGSEEDSNLSESTGGLNPAARIRKVVVFSLRYIWREENDLTIFFFSFFLLLNAST